MATSPSVIIIIKLFDFLTEDRAVRAEGSPSPYDVFLEAPDGCVDAESDQPGDFLPPARCGSVEAPPGLAASPDIRAAPPLRRAANRARPRDGPKKAPMVGTPPAPLARDFVSTLAYTIPVPKLQPARLLPGTRGPVCALEVFSGVGRLTEALSARGLSTATPMDVKAGPQFDLTRRSSQLALLEAIRRGYFWYIHFGTPCTVWSRARHNIKNLAKARGKERVGVELALFTTTAISLCRRLGILWSVENPASSRLWEFAPLHDVLRQSGNFPVTWDNCAFGEKFKKPTTLWTNFEALSSLGKRCCGGHRHEHLVGTERVQLSDGTWATRNKTEGAGAYSRQLCKQWSSLVASAAPRQARGGTGPPAFDALLQDAARRSASHTRGKTGDLTGPDPRQADPCRRADRYIRLHPDIVFGQHTQAETARRRRAAERSKARRAQRPSC